MCRFGVHVHDDDDASVAGSDGIVVDSKEFPGMAPCLGASF